MVCSGARVGRARTRKHSEDNFHVSVAQFLDRALPEGFEHTCFPAGGGGAIRGAWLKRRGLKRGMPDHVVFGQGFDADRSWYGPLILWLELKAAKGQVAPEQKLMHARLRGLGHKVVVAKTLEEVEAAAAEFCFPEALRARVA
jgi:hypothetical protein